MLRILSLPFHIILGLRPKPRRSALAILKPTRTRFAIA